MVRKIIHRLRTAGHRTRRAVPRFLAVLLLVWLCSASALAQTPAAETPPADSARAGVTDEELKDLIATLENDTQRAAFLARLKALAALRAQEKSETQAPEEIGARIIDRLFNAVDHLASLVVGRFRLIVEKAPRIPTVLGRAADRLTSPAARHQLWILLACFFGAALLSLIIGRGAARFRPAAPTVPTRLHLRLGRGLAGATLAVIPFGVMLLLMFGVFQFVSVPALARNLLMLVLFIVLCYQAAYHLGRALLAPTQAPRRVIPLAEEDALYVWIWWLRMARYTVFYSAITGGLDVMGLDPLTHDLVRGLLLAIYPVLLTLLVLQVRAELAGRFRLSALVEPIPLESSQSPAADVAPSENGSKGIAQEADRSARAGTGEGDPTKTQVSAEPSGPPPAEPPSAPNGFRKIFRLLLRFWWPLALGYVWAVFIALIGRYQSGLDYLVTATGQTVLAGLGLAFVLTLHHYGFLHLFAVNRRVRAKFPGLEEKTDRYLQVVRQVAKWLIVFVTLFILAQIWGIPVGGAVSSPRGLAALGRVLAVAFSVGVVAAVIETSRFVKRRLLEPRTGLEPSQKIRTFVPLVNTTIITVACFLGGVVVLGQLGVNVGPILAGAGIVGLAVGLGAQSLVKDFINGLFILVQDMIAVGDFIQVGDKSGQVEAITLRSVRIRDVSGNVHIIPSGMIDTVTNMSKVFSRYVLDVGVAYREDVDQVMELLRRIGREMEADPVFGPFILAPLEVLGVDRFDESAVVIRARVTTRPSRQWEVGREFNRRIKMLFDEYGIEIPFPHQTLYFGEPKTGPAPALRVIQVESGKGEGTRRLPDEHLPEPEEPAAEEAKDSDW